MTIWPMGRQEQKVKKTGVKDEIESRRATEALTWSKEGVDLLLASIGRFVQSRSTGRTGEYTMCSGGHATLYASCFAAMTLDYIGELASLPPVEKQAWIQYLQGWQDPESGLFVGPELMPQDVMGSKLHWDYHTMHLTVHVLPALHALGGTPSHPLTFAQRFLHLPYLKGWLDRRDWRDAWREGNNLLFVGQLLVHLAEMEGCSEAKTALHYFFDWLDEKQEPETGVWGTKSGSLLSYAVYGAYHQLLVYCYAGRPIQYAERIIDSVLSLQHPDGGFDPNGGGGACQDVDCADILVKLGVDLGYRQDDIRRALRRLLPSVIEKMAPDGGFVFRWGEPFIHHGLLWTYTPPNVPDLFSTWFRTHTVALISQVLTDEPVAQVPWRFNGVCSMGWHDANRRPVICQPSAPVIPVESPDKDAINGSPNYSLMERMRSLFIGRPSRLILAHVPQRWAERFVQEFVERYVSGQPSEEALYFLLKLEERIFPLTERFALEGTGQLLPTGWSVRHQHEFFVEHLEPGQAALHVGCETGELSYTLAALTGAKILGTDANPNLIAIAQSRYRHPQLSYFAGDPLYGLPDYGCDVIIVNEAVEQTPGNPAYLRQMWNAFHPASILMRLPRQSRPWQVLLRRSMAAKRGEVKTGMDGYSTRFLGQLAKFGFFVSVSEEGWGETWLKVVDDAAH